jgi:hypothetical protein
MLYIYIYSSAAYGSYEGLSEVEQNGSEKVSKSY